MQKPIKARHLGWRENDGWGMAKGYMGGRTENTEGRKRLDGRGQEIE